MGEADKLHSFLYGLIPEVRALVEMSEPNDVTEAMQKALAVDQARQLGTAIVMPGGGPATGNQLSEAIPMELGNTYQNKN